jgi:hypothetical protein
MLQVQPPLLLCCVACCNQTVYPASPRRKEHSKISASVRLTNQAIASFSGAGVERSAEDHFLDLRHTNPMARDVVFSV